MASMEIAPDTFRGLLAMKVAGVTRKRTRQVSDIANRGTVIINATIRVMLHLAGFGLLTMAGFQLNTLTGLIVAGFSCFVLSTLITRTPADNPTEVNHTHLTGR